MPSHLDITRARFVGVLALAAMLSACTGDAEPDDGPTTTLRGTASSPGGLHATLEDWADAFCETLTDWPQLGPLDAPDELVVYTDEQAWFAEEAPRLLDTTDAVIAALTGVEPPEPARPFHNQSVATLEAWRNTLEEALPKLAEATTVFEWSDAVRAYETVILDTAAGYRAELATIDPSVAMALEAEPGCGGTWAPQTIASSGGPVSAEIAPLLLTVDDMRSGGWRVIDLDEADYEDASIASTACVADLATGGVAPLNAIAPTEPVHRGGRLLFNGAIGNDGTQMLSEVWAFEAASAAADAFAAVVEELGSDERVACVEEHTLLSDPANGRDILLSVPTFESAGSLSYAVDVRDAIGGQIFESRIEIHVLHRGRFVGTVIAWDHAPARLWQVDSKRLLSLFEERLAAAP